MAGNEELEIEIDEAGKVKVLVRGRPGPACLDYVEAFRVLLSGTVTEQERTPEYYQAESGAHSARRVTARRSDPEG